MKQTKTSKFTYSDSCLDKMNKRVYTSRLHLPRRRRIWDIHFMQTTPHILMHNFLHFNLFQMIEQPYASLPSGTECIKKTVSKSAVFLSIKPYYLLLAHTSNNSHLPFGLSVTDLVIVNILLISLCSTMVYLF